MHGKREFEHLRLEVQFILEYPTFGNTVSFLPSFFPVSGKPLQQISDICRAAGQAAKCFYKYQCYIIVQIARTFEFDDQ